MSPKDAKVNQKITLCLRNLYLKEILNLDTTIDRTFTGYKGGDFTMSDDTVLWLDNYGECQGIAIIRSYKFDDDNNLIISVLNTKQ